MQERLSREEREAADKKISEALSRIMQHQSAGRFDEAGTLIDELMKEHEENPRLIHYKGFNLVQQGKTEEGTALIEAALEKSPEDPIQLADYGALLAQSGNLERAIELFLNAVEVAPNYSVARSNLGAALVLEKKYGEAIPHLQKAVELDAQLMDAHTNLASAYMQTNDFDRAVEVLFKALAIDPQSVGAHVQLSNALYRRERHEAAEHHARRAIELAPNAAEAYLHLGNALSSSGKLDEAAEVLLKVAGRPPVGLPALSRLIHMRKVTAEAPEFKMLEAALERAPDMPDEPRSTVYFAAGKAYDDLGDYGAAFETFRKANDINKKLNTFDPVASTERTDRLIQFASPALMQRCAGEGIKDIAPIFICGMPRSGTTLMDQMFSRHPVVQAGGELRAVPASMHRNTRLRGALEEKIPDEDITADDFNRLGEDYVAMVRQEGIRSEYVSDKMPSNYLYIGMLALALPRAKFLIMRRHPLDCLLSNYMQHFGRNQPFSSDFGWMATFYGNFDKTARTWATRLPEQVREVRYEDVVADTEGQMREILDFVELDWTADVLDYKSSMRQVNTASLSQVREPIYTRAVERWRRYGTNLAPMAEELRPWLSQDELEACGVKPVH